MKNNVPLANQEHQLINNKINPLDCNKLIAAVLCYLYICSRNMELSSSYKFEHVVEDVSEKTPVSETPSMFGKDQMVFLRKIGFLEMKILQMFTT